MYSTGAPRNWADLRSEQRTVITGVDPSYRSAVGLPCVPPWWFLDVYPPAFRHGFVGVGSCGATCCGYLCCCSWSLRLAAFGHTIHRITVFLLHPPVLSSAPIQLPIGERNHGHATVP